MNRHGDQLGEENPSWIIVKGVLTTSILLLNWPLSRPAVELWEVKDQAPIES